MMVHIRFLAAVPQVASGWPASIFEVQFLLLRKQPRMIIAILTQTINLLMTSFVINKFRVRSIHRTWLHPLGWCRSGDMRDTHISLSCLASPLCCLCAPLPVTHNLAIVEPPSWTWCSRHWFLSLHQYLRVHLENSLHQGSPMQGPPRDQEAYSPAQKRSHLGHFQELSSGTQVNANTDCFIDWCFFFFLNADVTAHNSKPLPSPLRVANWFQSGSGIVLVLMISSPLHNLQREGTHSSI